MSDTFSARQAGEAIHPEADPAVAIAMPALDQDRLRLRQRRRMRVYLHKALRPFRFRPRMSVTVLLGVAVYLLCRPFFETLRAILLSFDATSLGLIAACIVIAARTPTRMMARRAGEEDEQKLAVLISGVVVSAIVLAGLLLELKGVKQKSVDEIGLASATIVFAWGFLNILFSFHYAHEFYRLRKLTRKPMGFPGTPHPDYFDFIYFAFTIGMTFQVSDVDIRSGPIRHVAFVHALISFFFSVMVLGLIVNVFVGVLYFG